MAAAAKRVFITAAKLSPDSRIYKGRGSIFTNPRTIYEFEDGRFGRFTNPWKIYESEDAAIDNLGKRGLSEEFEHCGKVVFVKAALLS